MEEDLKTAIPRKLNLISREKLFEVAGHGMNLEGRQALQHAIDMGREGIWLELSEQQYRKLKGKP